MANVAACGGFSLFFRLVHLLLVTTMAKVAIPSNWRRAIIMGTTALSAGTIAAGVTLGILLPPRAADECIYGI